VKAVVDCFAGQAEEPGPQKCAEPRPGCAVDGTAALPGMDTDGFANDKPGIPSDAAFR